MDTLFDLDLRDPRTEGRHLAVGLMHDQFLAEAMVTTFCTLTELELVHEMNVSVPQKLRLTRCWTQTHRRLRRMSIGQDLEGIHHGAQPNGADAARPEGDVEAVRAIQAVQTDGVA